MSTPYAIGSDQSHPFEHHQAVKYPDPTLASAGNYPISCICPYCCQPIITRIEKDSGLTVWLSAAIICAFGCFCGCCLIPFCINDMKDTIHYCPNCNRIISTHSKLKF